MEVPTKCEEYILDMIHQNKIVSFRELDAKKDDDITRNDLLCTLCKLFKKGQITQATLEGLEGYEGVKGRPWRNVYSMAEYAESPEVYAYIASLGIVLNRDKYIITDALKKSYTDDYRDARRSSKRKYTMNNIELKDRIVRYVHYTEGGADVQEISKSLNIDITKAKALLYSLKQKGFVKYCGTTKKYSSDREKF